MIVEAMKTMNHVPSTADGEVKESFSSRWSSCRVWPNSSSFKIINVQKSFNSKQRRNCC